MKSKSMVCKRIGIGLAAWVLLSGLTAMAQEADVLLLSDFEGRLDDHWGGKMNRVVVAEKDPEFVKEGKQSGKWENLARNKWLVLNECPEDWSGYDRLAVWVYSEKKNYQQVNLIIYSDADPAETKNRSYYSAKFNVDWTGWELMEFQLSDFRKSRTPVGWDHITGVILTATAWGATPLEDTVLYLDAMRLEK